jgi:hypothetical protein
VIQKIRPLLVAVILSLSIFAVPTTSGASTLHHKPVIHLAAHHTPLKPVAATKPLMPLWEFKAWAWVGWCETHDNWTMEGPSYSGALGITRSNWVAYGGLRFAYDGAHATPIEQAFIASKIQGHYPIPDQPTGVYCNPTGW